MISERRRLFVGTSWTLFATAISIALGLVLRPIIVAYAGIDGYGIWAAALAIASLFGILSDLGVSAALTRTVAERRALGVELDTVAGSALLLGISIGALSGILLASLSFPVAGFFGFPGLADLLLIHAAQIPFILGAGSIVGLFQGQRRFRLLALFTILQVVGNLFLTIVLLAAGLGLVGVVLASLVTSAALFAALVARSRDLLRFSAAMSVFEDAKRLLPFGLKLTATNALSTLLYQADIVVVSLLLRNPVIVGTYALAVFVTRVLWIVPGAISVTTYPVTSEYAVAHHGVRLGEYLSTALVASVAITGAAASALLLFGQPLLGYLFGATAIPAFGLCVILLLGSGALGTLRSVAPSIPGIGRPDIGMWISALGASLVIALTIAMTRAWGEVGTAFAVSITFVSVAAALLWAINRYVLSPNRGVWSSRRIGLTVAVSVSVTAIAGFFPLPADASGVSIAFALGAWTLSLVFLSFASGGRGTWGAILRRSGTQALGRG